MKTCSKCGETKEFEAFHKDKCSKDRHRSDCKLCVKERTQANKENRAVYRREYYKANKERENERDRSRYRKNRSYVLKQQRDRYKKMKNDAEAYEAYRERRSKYVSIRRSEDALFRFQENLKNNVARSFKRNSNNWSKPTNGTEQILGCTMDQFKEHIESQLKDGMTFDNHGEWHLDHVIPLARAKTEQDVKMLCHYTNYQPMWAKDNLSKGAK